MLPRPVLVELGAWTGMFFMGVCICYLLYLGADTVGLAEAVGAGWALIWIFAGPVGATILSNCIIEYYSTREKP